MRIVFLPGDPDGPGHYRALFPAMALREAGFEAAMPPHTMTKHPNGFLEMGYRDDVMLALDADVYVFHTPMQVKTDHIGRALRERSSVVVDVDDYVLGVPTYVPNYREIQARAKHLHAAMAVADCVTVTTPFLAEAYSRYAQRIEILPNYLWWPMWEDAPLQYEAERERVRIGWMGSSGWRMSDLRVLQGIIGPFLRAHPEVDFVAAGDEKVHEILEVPEGQRVTYPHVFFRDWVDPEVEWTLPKITATMDIGLAPLELSNFNEGKSCLKGMEYGACGIPCIASPSAAYREWVDEGENGYTARKPKDWLRALETLVRDHGARIEMGRAARAKASEHTIDKHIGEWVTLYGSLVHESAREAIRLNSVQKVGELSALMDYLRNTEPQVVVEIGTAAGGTFHALAEVSADDALLISLDLPGKDGFKYADTVDPDKLQKLARPFQTTHFIRADSHAPESKLFLERLLAGRTIDLLFIDGDHSYEGVKADFDLYSPLVDGIVCFHDITKHPQGLRNQRGELTPCDVDRFWNEVKRRHRHAEFIDPRAGNVPWGGIGVVHVNRARELKGAA